MFKNTKKIADEAVTENNKNINNSENLQQTKLNLFCRVFDKQYLKCGKNTSREINFSTSCRRERIGLGHSRKIPNHKNSTRATNST